MNSGKASSTEIYNDVSAQTPFREIFNLVHFNRLIQRLSKKLIDNNISYGYNTQVTKDELKTWRRQNDYTQAGLAKTLGVGQVAVARWETDVRKIPPFLHYALRCLELEGGEPVKRGKRKKKKEV